MVVDVFLLPDSVPPPILMERCSEFGNKVKARIVLDCKKTLTGRRYSTKYFL